MVSNWVIISGLLKGLTVTLETLFLSVMVSLVLAFLFGFMNLSKWKIIKLIAHIYIEVFRGTSLLVQMFWLFFCLPLFGLNLPPLTVGVLALGLNYGAYGAVVVTASIQSVPKPQIEAAIALNLSPLRKMTAVILPQAFRLMLPTFSNLTIELLKGTSLVSLVTLSDLTFQAIALRSATMETTRIFIYLLIFYFLIAYPITLGFKWLEKRLYVGRG
ncbi:MAG: ectoine/hydroxyectoine ABC transporter permease subunit EhuC [Sporolactobacillus sp.]